jgi:hypothetical protein
MYFVLSKEDNLSNFLYLQLVQIGSNIRNLFMSYEKLVAIDQDLVMDHLLLPLLDANGSIPRALYHGVNTHMFLM